MTEAIRSWIIGLTGAALLTAAAVTITPKGNVRNIVRFLCGLVTVIMLLRPLIGIRLGDFSKYLAQFNGSMEAASMNFEQENERLERAIIEERTGAYILDKAEELGIETCRVEAVAAMGEDGCWYPYSAAVYTAAGAAEQKALSDLMERELGIPAERQYWSTEDG